MSSAWQYGHLANSNHSRGIVETFLGDMETFLGDSALSTSVDDSIGQFEFRPVQIISPSDLLGM